MYSDVVFGRERNSSFSSELFLSRESYFSLPFSLARTSARSHISRRRVSHKIYKARDFILFFIHFSFISIIRARQRGAAVISASVRNRLTFARSAVCTARYVQAARYSQKLPSQCIFTRRDGLAPRSGRAYQSSRTEGFFAK